MLPHTTRDGLDHWIEGGQRRMAIDSISRHNEAGQRFPVTYFPPSVKTYPE